MELRSDFLRGPRLGLLDTIVITNINIIIIINLACKNGVEIRSLKRTKLEMVGNTVERVRLVGTVHQSDDGGDELMMVMMMIDGNGSSLLLQKRKVS